MLSPVYGHPDDAGHSHGVTIPDILGCFSATDTWDALPKVAQETVGLCFDGEPLDVPPPAPLETLARDAAHQDGGAWLLVDLDLSSIRAQSVRLNISLPKPLV